MAKIKKIKVADTVYDICDADALHSHQTIKQDGVTGATVNRYGVCSTAVGTAAKTVSITTGTFKLETGARVTVKFGSKNTANSPTLNVNSTGAKNIFHNGAQITSGSNKGMLYGTVDFVYDGTQWHLVGNYVDTDTNTHNSHKINSGKKSDGSTDIISAEASSGNITLGDSGVTAGTYRSVTVNSKGIVVAGSSTDTDTKNTAGSTNSSDKLFLIGATSQAANPQTYSHDTAYVGTDGCLYSNGSKVLTSHQSIYDLTLKGAGTTVTTFDPNGAANSLDIVAGNNVTITPDATNKKITISSTDTNTNTTYDLSAAKNKSNGSVTLDLTAGGSGSGTDSVTIKGTGATTVTTDANGVITISSTDTNTNTSHSHSAGVGLVGSGGAGTSGGTYDYKAKLRSETALSVDSDAATTTSGRVYPVAVDKSGYLSVNVPWTDTNTDTKVTAVGNHYTPSSDTSAELTASLSGTAGTYAKDTEYTVLTGVKAQRDAKGHVTGITYTAQKIKDTNTDTDTHYTNYLQINGNGTEAIKYTQDSDKTLNLKPGSNVSISAATGEITINATDTNTWRPVVDNLTSTATDSSLSAAQGKVLNDKFANYLPKTTYEYNKEIAFGSTGKLYIGAFPMYDSNITVEISATTSTTYNATLVIATQNINTTGGGSLTATVYGDATNTIAPNIYIGYASGSNKIHVYFSPQSWSKNLIHIQAVALAGAPSNVCTSVDSIPSTATRKPTNALTANFQAKGNYLTSIPTASADTLGGVKVGDNITVSSGKISLTKANVTNALGTSSTGTGFLKQDGTWATPTDTKYTHPTYTSKTSGLYKITVDGTGHVSGTAAVTKSDITGLGIPGSDTTYTSKTAASGGTAVSLVTTGEKYNWNNKTTLAAVEDFIEANSEEVDLGTYFTKSDVTALFEELFEFDGTTLIIKDQ